VPEMGSSIGHRAPRGPGARKLSTHQQAVLIQILLNFPDEPVGVCCLTSANGASEAAAYAEDFLTVFKAINWTVDRVEKAESLPQASSGLAIIAKETPPPPSAEALRDGLRIYEIEAEIVEDRENLCGDRKFVLAVT
jgi:hypothetical protein